MPSLLGHSLQSQRGNDAFTDWRDGGASVSTQSSAVSRECASSPLSHPPFSDVLTDHLAATFEATDMGFGCRAGALGGQALEEQRHLEQQRRLEEQCHLADQRRAEEDQCRKRISVVPKRNNVIWRNSDIWSNNVI